MLCESPAAMSAQEVDSWLRDRRAVVGEHTPLAFEVERLTQHPVAADTVLSGWSRSRSPAQRDVERLFDEAAFNELLDDMKLAGMRPTAAVGRETAPP